MKTIKEITENRRLHIDQLSVDGGSGVISMPGWMGSVIFSKGGGWEHISVSPSQKRITPSWDDMVRIKDMFWNDDEAVIQIHPAKADYVNNMPNCLHLWRCYYKDMLLPPSCFVGIRKGQTQSELLKEIKAAYELAGEVFN